ncbi:MAG: bifunctional diaminohydroxyphosphoribosylaminopyrimidine deaminase/5-amino-6-(5-phosphoribosylamino)uracil reductase RibD [Filifactor alocis]|nr:bifunctional diaminohydroxyphosphoribosylaminopyrimidine deaminase/5-amino-6-(5-phosphoribosylamino)uracil reductase RibD [Filifactor alocis]
MDDRVYMKMALELAEKGRGFVNPNPMVGSVIVKDNAVIGSGFHERYGSFHAERNALNGREHWPQGSVLYVTLEPCCHHGKTPPCTDIIIDKNISKVVIGTLDPNPLVRGKGVEILRSRGIEVEVGVMEEECLKLNEVFFHFILRKTPFTVMKYAMSIDGKIACANGESKWITGEKARRKVHEDRHNYSAIMAGIGTVLRDDPLLNCRIEGRKNPVRIVCDSSLRLPMQSRLVHTAGEIPTILATCCTDEKKYDHYIEAGLDIICTPSKKGRVDLKVLMEELGRRKIDSLLLEGGGCLNWSALNEGIVHRVQAYISPKILGGAQAKTPVSGEGVTHPDRAFFLTRPEVKIIGRDVLLESEVVHCSQES